jgi:phage host-nuclease inhibitor protein Gam
MVMPVFNPGHGLKPYAFWCHKVIPLVYDDSLSYYEQICKLTQAMQDVIENITADYEAYTDSKVGALREELTSRMTAFESEIMDILQEQTEYNESTRQWVQTEIFRLETLLNEQLAYFYKVLIDNVAGMKLWYFIQIEKLKEEISCLANYSVINPITQQREMLQDVLNQMYEMMRYCALTAEQYDALGMTTEKYDWYGLTCVQYDNCAKKYFTENTDILMYHPATGKFADYRQVIYWLSDFHRDSALTSIEYDYLLLTAETYDEYALTAYEYDFTGKGLLN